MKIHAKYDRAFRQWLASRRQLSAAKLRRELEQLDVDVLDRWAFGLAGGDIVKLDPKDIAIVHTDDLENAEYQADRFAGSRLAWAKSVSLTEPVIVSVTRPGEFILEDGHHRYLAAKLSKRKLSAEITIKGKPIEWLLDRAIKTPAKLDREIAEVLAKGR